RRRAAAQCLSRRPWHQPQAGARDGDAHHQGGIGGAGARGTRGDSRLRPSRLRRARPRRPGTMRFPLATIAFAPLLLWQGRRVRRAVLRLPEAGGARTGTVGEGERLRLLVLGDSSAAGVGVADQADALAGQLVALLAIDHRVLWRLEAGSGDQLADLLARLDTLAHEDFDAVVVAIGVNDATARTGTTAWRAGLRRLLAGITARFGEPLVLVC